MILISLQTRNVQVSHLARWVTPSPWLLLKAYMQRCAVQREQFSQREQHWSRLHFTNSYRYQLQKGRMLSQRETIEAASRDLDYTVDFWNDFLFDYTKMPLLFAHVGHL